jgi:hypothetical protein
MTDMIVQGSYRFLRHEVMLHAMRCFGEKIWEIFSKNSHSHISGGRPKPGTHKVTSTLGDLEIPYMLTHTVNQIVSTQHKGICLFGSKDALTGCIGNQGGRPDIESSRKRKCNGDSSRIDEADHLAQINETTGRMNRFFLC